MFGTYFEASLWWKLSRPLKQRWWLETEYGRNPPSEELLQKIRMFTKESAHEEFTTKEFAKEFTKELTKELAHEEFTTKGLTTKELTTKELTTKEFTSESEERT